MGVGKPSKIQFPLPPTITLHTIPGTSMLMELEMELLREETVKTFLRGLECSKTPAQSVFPQENTIPLSVIVLSDSREGSKLL